LKCLGYTDDSPEMQWALKQLDDLLLEEEKTVRVQPCFSPVWDTALSLNASAMAGLPGHNRSVVRGIRWLLEREVRRPGDWSIANPRLEPTGWCFEYRNGFYPDIDDTAMVLMAMARTGHAGSPQGHPAAERALRWLLGMQNKDGGWAAFDRDINRNVLTKVPFADHNAMLDPPTVDITGRILECLATYGYDQNHPAVKKAIKFIRDEQESDGSWFGRWGVNYIYGTALVLRGLEAIGVDRNEPMIQQAAEWLRMVQNADGGWGETVGSYDDPNLRGQGDSTASQTAWAIMGLLAVGDTRSECVARGIAYLLKTQNKDGSWDEAFYTGTGFPRVFYLKYHLYRQYFPLIALTAYSKVMAEKS
jgi:squalene-hopene/tetraprenyl-beta-curcumene cyclase